MADGGGGLTGWREVVEYDLTTVFLALRAGAKGVHQSRDLFY